MRALICAATVAVLACAGAGARADQKLGPQGAVPTTISVKDFGAKCDASLGAHGTDDTLAIQKALTAAVGKKLVFPSNTLCRTTAAVTVLGSSATPPLATIIDLNGGGILKDFAALSGEANAAIQTAGLTSAIKQNNITIQGPGVIQGSDTSGYTKTGVVFALYGDDLTLRNFEINTYSGGQAILFSGDRGLVASLKIKNPNHATGVGGIRVTGGDGFVGAFNYVESGDDSIQFVPEPPSNGGPLVNHSITNGLYLGNTGFSTNARFIAIGLIDPAHAGTMTCGIRNVSFRDNAGRGANRVLFLANLDGHVGAGGGDIDGVVLDNNTLTVGATCAACGDEAILEQDATATGVVSHVVVRRLRLVSPTKVGLKLLGSDVSKVIHVTLEDLNFDASSGAGFPSISVDEATDVALVRPHLRGNATADVVSVGGFGSNVIDQFTLYGGTIEQIYNGFSGVKVNRTTNPAIAETAFIEAASNDTALAVTATANTSGMTVSHLNTGGLVANPILSDSSTFSNVWNSVATNQISRTLKANASLFLQDVGNATPAAGVLSVGTKNLVNVLVGDGVSVSTITASAATPSGMVLVLHNRTGSAIPFTNGASTNNITFNSGAGYSLPSPGTLIVHFDGARWVEDGHAAGGGNWFSGTGVPAINCAIGDLYSNRSGGASTTLYVCTAANTWTAK